MLRRPSEFLSEIDHAFQMDAEIDADPVLGKLSPEQKEDIGILRDVVRAIAIASETGDCATIGETVVTLQMMIARPGAGPAKQIASAIVEALGGQLPSWH